MKRLEYCEKCREEKEYVIINDVEFVIEYENKILKYIGKKAVCKVCGEEVFSEEVEEYNQLAFEKAYMEQNEIISTNDIDVILNKYKIGKRPLSLLLGWGETTISRYYQNNIPSIKNSKVLKSILENPNVYYDYLMTNNDKISEVAYKKSKDKLDVILGIKDENSKLNDDNIINVSKYIISKIDITPMGLQKLLYYVQVLFSCFYGRSIFSSRCNAWNHGPVFGKVYHEYKSFGFNTIKNQDNINIELEEELKEVVDIVIKYFGCYSAKTLEYFTHNEEPWKNAINSESKIIEKNAMRIFGEKLIKENNISSINEIYKYSHKMYNQYFNSIINGN